MTDDTAKEAENFIKEQFTKTSALNKYLTTALFKDEQFLEYAKRVSQGRMRDEAFDNIEALISSELDLNLISTLIATHLKYRMGVDIDDTIFFTEGMSDENSDD